MKLISIEAVKLLGLPFTLAVRDTGIWKFQHTDNGPVLHKLMRGGWVKASAGIALGIFDLGRHYGVYLLEDFKDDYEEKG